MVSRIIEVALLQLADHTEAKINTLVAFVTQKTATYPWIWQGERHASER